MAIKVHLEDVLKARGMTSKELCALVGITEANLSILRSGKAKGIRFGTVNRICYFLHCDVGDILKFDGRLEEEEHEMQKKYKRILALDIALLALFLFAGCQLAKEEDGETESAERDRLIGVFLTREHLDLFDWEGYFNDNAGALAGGGHAIDETDTAAYGGRLYATLTRETRTDDAGEQHEWFDCTFEGIEGIRYFVVEEGITTHLISDPGISGVHQAITDTEEAKRIDLEAVLYVEAAAETETVVWYLNPVYQSTDGSVYLTAGHGTSLAGGMTEGASFSTKFDETETVTVDGKSVETGASVSVRIESKFPAERINVLQMDAGHAVVARTEYDAGALPEEIVPLPGTEYLIVETVKRDLAGEEIVSRALYGREETKFITFCRGDGTVLLEQYTRLEWEQLNGMSA